MRFFSIVFAMTFGLFATTQLAQAVTINVNLSGQTMHVTSASGENYTWAISSGKTGFNTPRGYYKPTRLAKMHYSRKYDMTPMPHSIFFRGGYAIHATSDLRALGRPASHGCIRLAPRNAAKLFDLVKREGARIAINGTPPGDTHIARAPRTKPAALAYAPKKQPQTLRLWWQNPVWR